MSETEQKKETGIKEPEPWSPEDDAHLNKVDAANVLLADIHVLAHRMGGGLQKIPFHFLDLGIAGEHFVLQAQELSLSTCWIGWFNVKKATGFLKVPRSVKICSLLTVGYKADGWKSKKRRLKPLKDIVFENTWGKQIKS